MPRSLEPSEEYILAAFMSGELPDSLRQEIIAYLAGHEQARDLLAMAQEAMEAVETGDGSARMAAPSPSFSPGLRLPQFRGRLSGIKAPVTERNLWKITAFFAGAVLVLTVVVAALALSTSRLQQALVGQPWAPTVNGSELTLEWDRVPGASVYQVMQYDPDSEQAAIIGRTESQYADLMSMAPHILAPSRPIWIMAFGPDGQFLDLSEPVRVQVASD